MPFVVTNIHNFSDDKRDEFWLDLCCLTPLSTIYQLHVYCGGQFIGGENQNTRRKTPTCRKSLTNFIT